MEQYVDNLYCSYPGVRISLAIEGIEAFFRLVSYLIGRFVFYKDV